MGPASIVKFGENTKDAPDEVGRGRAAAPSLKAMVPMLVPLRALPLVGVLRAARPRRTRRSAGRGGGHLPCGGAVRAEPGRRVARRGGVPGRGGTGSAPHPAPGISRGLRLHPAHAPGRVLQPAHDRHLGDARPEHAPWRPRAPQKLPIGRQRLQKNPRGDRGWRASAGRAAGGRGCDGRRPLTSLCRT